ncbi:DUF3558 domain-containing protein [Actinophytocola xanthii]|uniref:DUF3558 domain-containing protein n=1 Tax=Actinophytocola xanthii TaxID=1912961 RepID=A0A1Q8CFW5_9PSEU|nr:DUF3558 domain-containing protein [Actinophytocola xanthii]OLF13258.1 hypothetical protein BU204_28175 [Actinophytocola xanthii]
MRRVAALSLAGLLTLVLCAACTNSTGGEATPTDTTADAPSGGSSSTPAPSSSGPTPTVEIPPRPRDLSLTGVEPCSLLTAPQLEQLASRFKFDEPPESDVRKNSKKYPFCSIEQSAEPFSAIDIVVATDEGIEPWLSGRRNVDAWLVTIAGYPAANYKLMGTEDEECVTSVGVADGQQLIVDLQPLVDTDYRQLCQVTEQVATWATQTLQTLR